MKRLIFGILFLINNAHAENLIYWNSVAISALAKSSSIQKGNQDGSSALSGVQLALFSKEQDPCGLAIDAKRGKIYWGEVSKGGIRVGNLDGSGEPITLFADGSVCGVAIDPIEQRIYWTKPESDLIRAANLDGTGPIVTLFSEPVGSSPTAIVIDPSKHKIYWTNRRSHQIRSGSIYGGLAQSLYSNEKGAAGIALDSESKKLYWASFFAGQIRVGSTEGEVATTLYGGENPAGIAIDTDLQRIYWGNFLTGEVRVGNLSGILIPTTVYATQNRASFPVLLQKPIGLEPPLVSVSAESSENNNLKYLNCSTPIFAPDNIEAFLYRSPSYIIYTWFHNGREINGASRSSIIVSEPGIYTCATTGLNAAGSSNMLSKAFLIMPPDSSLVNE